MLQRGTWACEQAADVRVGPVQRAEPLGEAEDLAGRRAVQLEEAHQQIRRGHDATDPVAPRASGDLVVGQPLPAEDLIVDEDAARNLPGRPRDGLRSQEIVGEKTERGCLILT